TSTSRSAATGSLTIRSTCSRCRPGSPRSTRRPSDRMSDEAEETVPDEPLDTLVDAEDHDVREETRATSRENLRVYLKEIVRIPLLTREQESELGRRVRAGDAAAKARLTEANLRLVVQIARRYLNRGLPLPDLLEEIRLQPVSLETPIGEGEGRVSDLIADPSADPRDTLVSLFRERTDLVSVLDDLAANERTVLRRRFGLEGDPPEKLEAIGQRLGLTRERIRQIEAAGLRKLRALLGARGIDASDLF